MNKAKKEEIKEGGRKTENGRKESKDNEQRKEDGRKEGRK